MYKSIITKKDYKIFLVEKAKKYIFVDDILQINKKYKIQNTTTLLVGQLSKITKQKTRESHYYIIKPHKVSQRHDNYVNTCIYFEFSDYKVL